jgi:DNA-binding CsgD family transcriptional regulator/PAS domain-containing protein
MSHAASVPTPAKAGTTTSETRERSIIGSIYDAALDRSRWSESLSGLSNYARLGDSFLAVANPRTMSFPLIEMEHSDRTVEREFLQNWATPERNLWLRAAATVMPVGLALSLDRFVPRQLLEQTDHYRRLLVPWHAEQCIGSVLARGQDGMAIYSAYRSGRDPSFDERDEEILGRFAPHLRRALQVQQRLCGVEAAGRQALEVLHHLELGVVLLDGRQRVLFANRSASDIMARGDGLSETGGELVASLPETAKSLACLLTEATCTGRRRGRGAGGALLLKRPSGKRALSVLVAPLGDNPFHLGTRVPVAAVFLTDLERRHSDPMQAFARLYRLTPREAVVADLVARGASLRQVADTLGVAVSTVRTHLYRVFDKVGVRRQAELVKLVLTEPSAWRAQ